MTSEGTKLAVKNTKLTEECERLRAELGATVRELAEVSYGEFGTHRNPDGMSDKQRERHTARCALSGLDPESLEPCPPASPVLQGE